MKRIAESTKENPYFFSCFTSLWVGEYGEIPPPHFFFADFSQVMSAFFFCLSLGLTPRPRRRRRCSLLRVLELELLEVVGVAARELLLVAFCVHFCPFLEVRLVVSFKPSIADVNISRVLFAVSPRPRSRPRIRASFAALVSRCSSRWSLEIFSKRTRPADA